MNVYIAGLCVYCRVCVYVCYICMCVCVLQGVCVASCMCMLQNCVYLAGVLICYRCWTMLQMCVNRCVCLLQVCVTWTAAPTAGVRVASASVQSAGQVNAVTL